MARLRRKLINGRFYVLANVQGRVVTYQLKPSLHHRFCSEGRKAGDRLDQTEVVRLAQSGELYTKGIAPPVSAPHPEFVFSPLNPAIGLPSAQTTEFPEKPHSDARMTSLVQPISPEVHPASTCKKVAIFIVALAILAVVIWVVSGASKNF
jgi:hypothetical protein